MAALEEHLHAYRETGYAVVSDAIPADAALKAREIFATADYDHIEQIRKQHYSHVFKMNAPGVPQEDEVYIARFFRSGQIERDGVIQAIFQEHILPRLVEISGVSLSQFDLRGYKMEKGDGMRLHVDDYTAEVGFIYYLSKRWAWDWGGILNMWVDNKIEAALPQFNQLIVLNHGQRRVPHFVSQVTDYALEPRFMLVGFNR